MSWNGMGRRGDYRPVGTDRCDRGRFRSMLPEQNRFWSKVALPVPPSQCFLWQGLCNAFGYGRFTTSAGVDVLAHRYAYEQIVGPIPEGLTLDHLCNEPACVRVGHLEPVPNSENLRRRHARRRAREDSP